MGLCKPNRDRRAHLKGPLTSYLNKVVEKENPYPNASQSFLIETLASTFWTCEFKKQKKKILLWFLYTFTTYFYIFISLLLYILMLRFYHPFIFLLFLLFFSHTKWSQLPSQFNDQKMPLRSPWNFFYYATPFELLAAIFWLCSTCLQGPKS